MRCAICLSSFAKAFSASGENSIRQTIPLHQFVQRNRLGFAGAHRFQLAFGEIEIFEVVEIFENGGARVKTFAPACALGERLQAFLDFRGKAEGEQGEPRLLYKYSTWSRP
jgi:hypothetical protein